jgi:hypothetical protein
MVSNESWPRTSRGLGRVVASGESWSRTSRGLGRAVASGESWSQTSHGLVRVVASGELWPRACSGLMRVVLAPCPVCQTVEASTVGSVVEGNKSLIVQCPVHSRTEGNLDLLHKERDND